MARAPSLVCNEPSARRLRHQHLAMLKITGTAFHRPHQPSMNLVVVLTSPSQPAPRASKNRHTPSAGIDTISKICPATFSTRLPRAFRSRQRPDVAPFPPNRIFASTAIAPFHPFPPHASIRGTTAH
ncbi:hypothetical protein GQ607_006277 [Colletotrichum asianum]|uniref:Uncharacterized protein n=1 Tax=Colletotrichum asianum TaxID=702518 RepID=A0A8H3ZSZ9_9PEZI|nr:hypothetical protein GQ607_006277 [Colletotrichum asianum]